MKKQLFAVLTMMGLFALVLFAPNLQSQGTASPQLEGSWTITVLPDGGQPFINFATVTRGGGIINSVPDVPFSAGHGAWQRISGNQFGITFHHFIGDLGGGAPMTVKVRAEVTLQGDTFTGPFQTDVFAPDGVLVDSFAGMVLAERMSVEALN